MTFDNNAQIDTSRVSKRSGAKRGGMIAGGGIGIALLLAFGSQLLGFDLTPFALAVEKAAGGILGGSTAEERGSVEQCETGADANKNTECRMTATSDLLERYWGTQVDGYQGPADVVLFSGQTSSRCGTASSATGPFYCPADESIFLDVSFFDTLRSDYGSSDGSLAQMYVLAHEWGHHISNITGSMKQVGRETGASSGSVRLELQADCFAGAWVKDASAVPDKNGHTYMQPVTQRQIADALSAASAVGDDHIMESAGVEVQPERFTHGTSEQRQRWFQEGYSKGAGACDTFSVPAKQL